MKCKQSIYRLPPHSLNRARLHDVHRIDERHLNQTTRQCTIQRRGIITIINTDHVKQAKLSPYLPPTEPTSMMYIELPVLEAI